MSKHTPGPWEVGNAPHSDCRIYAPSEVHAIARTYGPDLNGIGVCALAGPMNQADACLIAAAPELLKALQTTVAELIDAGFGASPYGLTRASIGIETGLAAIAKATGEA
jgi:hypothetical protein